MQAFVKNVMIIQVDEAFKGCPEAGDRSPVTGSPVSGYGPLSSHAGGRG